MDAYKFKILLLGGEGVILEVIERRVWKSLRGIFPIGIPLFCVEEGTEDGDTVRSLHSGSP